MYQEEYRKAMEGLPFSPDFQEKTARRMQAHTPRRKRRRWPALVAAALSAVLVVHLLLWPAATTDGVVPGLWACAAAQPDYPDYPRQGRFFDFTYHKRWRTYRHTIPNVDEEYADLAAAFSDRTSALMLPQAQGKNLIFSPANLWLGLSVLAETTGGASKEAILEAMGGLSPTLSRTQYEALWRNLYRDDGLTVTLPANSLWLNKGLDYDDDTTRLLSEHYFTGSYQVELGTKKADRSLSKWLRAHTDGRLTGLGPGAATDPDAVFALFSTLLYSGEWSDKFDPGDTYDDTFTLPDGTEITVPFMHRAPSPHDIMATICVEGYNAACLPNENTSVWFILPDEGVTAEELASDPALWNTLWDGFDGEPEDRPIQYRQVEWAVPRFDVSSEADLRDTLSALGLSGLFSPEEADFSGLFPHSETPVFLSSARQTTRIEADEEGIRGVSALQFMGAGAAPPEDEICRMVLDRPFLIAVTSPSEGLLLFSGIVNDPRG